MPTTVIDERKLLAAGFRLEARHLVRGQSLWSRDDQPDRSYLDDEAIAWLERAGASGRSGGGGRGRDLPLQRVLELLMGRDKRPGSRTGGRFPFSPRPSFTSLPGRFSVCLREEESHRSRSRASARVGKSSPRRLGVIWACSRGIGSELATARNDVVSALLRQSGGFEGFRPIQIAAYSDDLPLPDRPDVVDHRFHRDAAAASLSEEPRCHDDVIPQIHELLWLPPEVAEGFAERLKEAANPVVPVEGLISG
jgi:hypothetical protein